MPRGLERRHGEGHFHFVTFSCFHRRLYLVEPKARDVFESSLEAMRRKYGFRVDSFVVMPTHVHLLISQPPNRTVSVALQALKISVAKRLTQRPFWQARFHDFNVFTDRKRLEKRRYIHRNPVRGGLVAHPHDWAWSSFRHWAYGHEGVVEVESNWTFARRMSVGLSMTPAPEILQTHISKARCGAPTPTPNSEGET